MLSYIFNYDKNKSKVLAFVILYFACLLELSLGVVYSSKCAPVATLPVSTNILNIVYVCVIVGGSLINVFGITLVGLLIAWLLKLTRFKKSSITTKYLLHLIISVYPIKNLISSIVSVIFISYLSVSKTFTYSDIYPVYNNTHTVTFVLSIIIIILLICQVYKRR